MRMKAVSDAGNHDHSVHNILIRFNLLTRTLHEYSEFPAVVAYCFKNNT